MMHGETTAAEQGMWREPRPERAAEAADGVVADVAHALRNHFHRLYYWIDLVGEHGVEGEGRSALDAAVTAVRAIERLTGGTMALSRAIDLTCITMTAAELCDYAAQSLRRHGATAEAPGADAPAGAIQVDPGYMSQLIEVVGRRLGVGTAGAVPVAVHAELDGADWMLVTIQAPGAGPAADDDVEARLEWALAERIAERHGGRLVWETAGAAARRALLLLPMQP